MMIIIIIIIMIIIVIIIMIMLDLRVIASVEFGSYCKCCVWELPHVSSGVTANGGF